MSKNERNIFDELQQGINEMHLHHNKKLTLKTHYVEEPKKIIVSPNFIRSTRKQMHLSQNLFARLFRVSKRTLEKWEQGETHPNEQAAALIMLIKRHPELLEELAGL